MKQEQCAFFNELIPKVTPLYHPKCDSPPDLFTTSRKSIRPCYFQTNATAKSIFINTNSVICSEECQRAHYQLNQQNYGLQYAIEEYKSTIQQLKYTIQLDIQQKKNLQLQIQCKEDIIARTKQKQSKYEQQVLFLDSKIKNLIVQLECMEKKIQKYRKQTAENTEYNIKNILFKAQQCIVLDNYSIPQHPTTDSLYDSLNTNKVEEQHNKNTLLREEIITLKRKIFCLESRVASLEKQKQWLERQWEKHNKKQLNEQSKRIIQSYQQALIKKTVKINELEQVIFEALQRQNNRNDNTDLKIKNLKILLRQANRVNQALRNQYLKHQLRDNFSNFITI